MATLPDDPNLDNVPEITFTRDELKDSSSVASNRSSFNESFSGKKNSNLSILLDEFKQRRRSAFSDPSDNSTRDSGDLEKIINEDSTFVRVPKLFISHGSASKDDPKLVHSVMALHCDGSFYNSKITYCLPIRDSNSVEAAILDTVRMFVFPTEKLEFLSSPQGRIHSFVLATPVGVNLHGFTLIRAPFQSQFENDLRKPQGENLINLNAICILSVYNYPLLFEEILKAFRSYEISNESINYLYNNLNFSPPGLVTIKRSATHPASRISIPRISSGKLRNFHPITSLLHWSLPFRLLSADNFLKLYTAMLNECSVIAVSWHIELLSPFLESMIAFLYPFRWVCLYIPLMPVWISELIQAPQSLLCGILKCDLDSFEIPENSVLVDLDQDEVSISNPDIIPLSWRDSWRLFEAIIAKFPPRKIFVSKSAFVPEIATAKSESKRKKLDSIFLEGSDSDFKIMESPSKLLPVLYSKFLRTHAKISYESMNEMFSGNESDDDDSKFEEQDYPYGMNTPSSTFGNSLLRDIDNSSDASLDYCRRKFLNVIVSIIGHFEQNMLSTESKGYEPFEQNTNSDLKKILFDEKLDSAKAFLMSSIVMNSWLSPSSGLSDPSPFSPLSPIEEKSMDSYSKSNRKYNTATVKIFDQESFVSRASPCRAEFLRKISSTQMFAYFIQERLEGKAMTLFDKSLKNWKQRLERILLANSSRKIMGCMWKRGARVSSWSWRLIIIDFSGLEFFIPNGHLIHCLEKFNSLKRQSGHDSKTKKELSELSREIKILHRKYFRGKLLFDPRDFSVHVEIPLTREIKYRTPYPFIIRTSSRSLLCAADDGNLRADWVQSITSLLELRKRENFSLRSTGSAYYRSSLSKRELVSFESSEQFNASSSPSLNHEDLLVIQRSNTE